MCEAPPSRLLITCAGRPWLVQLEGPQPRDELAAVLGAWARVPSREEEPPAGAGVIRILERDLADATAGVERRAEGLRIRSRDYELLLFQGEGQPYVEVTCRPGCSRKVAGRALRIAVLHAALMDGGLVLHASSVKTTGSAYVFAGMSGAGKTTAAGAFPPEDRLDDDLVILGAEDGRWARLDFPDREQPRRFDPVGPGGLKLAAVLLPEPADAFVLSPLRGAEAVRECLHLPWFASGYEGAVGEDELSRLLGRVEDLVSAVPVLRVGWALSDDLPRLLREALG
jgi:hypothetical protein